MMSKSWMGNISGISLDWHEGVFIETLASPPALVQTVHGPMPGGVSSVHYEAKCCLCEWAYDKPGEVDLKGEQATIGHTTPDIEGVMGWVQHHRNVDVAHGRARREFKRRKFEEKKGP